MHRLPAFPRHPGNAGAKRGHRDGLAIDAQPVTLTDQPAGRLARMQQCDPALLAQKLADRGRHLQRAGPIDHAGIDLDPLGAVKIDHLLSRKAQEFEFAPGNIVQHVLQPALAGLGVFREHGRGADALRVRGRGALEEGHGGFLAGELLAGEQTAPEDNFVNLAIDVADIGKAAKILEGSGVPYRAAPTYIDIAPESLFGLGMRIGQT